MRPGASRGCETFVGHKPLLGLKHAGLPRGEVGVKEHWQMTRCPVDRSGCDRRVEELSDDYPAELAVNYTEVGCLRAIICGEMRVCEFWKVKHCSEPGVAAITAVLRQMDEAQVSMLKISGPKILGSGQHFDLIILGIFRLLALVGPFGGPTPILDCWGSCALRFLKF